MKKIIGLLAMYASLAVVATPAFATIFQLTAQAQTPTPAAPATPGQGACTDESKAAWYADFTKFRTTDAKKAYEAGKQYLTACPNEQGQIPDYLKKWVAAYEKEARKLKVTPLIYGEKKYVEGLAMAKEILAEEPENLRVIVDLGYGSYLAAATLKNESYNTDALTHIRKAIQLIESGKTPESWAPFKGKDDTLAYLYNSLGRITLKTNQSEGLTALIKSAQFESELKKDPWTYFFIATAYEAGPYAKLSADYKTRFEGKDETPESKLALANVQQVIDRMIDGYARAVALAGSDAKYQANKPEWLDSLTTWYKYRHNQSDAGLTDLIAGVMSKPLPPEPTPLTTLPAAPATSTAPASGSTSTAGATATSEAAAPSANKTTTGGTVAPSTTSTTTKSTTTPTATPKPPVKPKNNHRRH
jgi:tetratricopeptide (TPR) repeat protein